MSIGRSVIRFDSATTKIHTRVSVLGEVEEDSWRDVIIRPQSGTIEEELELVPKNDLFTTMCEENIIAYIKNKIFF